mgnify:CR=1 FL=1
MKIITKIVPFICEVKIVKRMIPFKAAIFDMDGVIVDNHNYHVKAWEIFCQKHKIPFNESYFRAKFFGKINQDIFRDIIGGSITREQIDILGEEKEQIYRDIYKDFIKPINGLIPFLKSLKASGIKTAVATSAPTSNLDFTIDSLNIRDLFDVIVDASMVTKGKPDPEIYLKAANKLNIDPDNCVVFEDSISGIKSGQNAGMMVVALITTHSLNELPKTPIAIKDFTEISIKNIIESKTIIEAVEKNY